VVHGVVVEVVMAEVVTVEDITGEDIVITVAVTGATMEAVEGAAILVNIMWLILMLNLTTKHKG